MARRRTGIMGALSDLAGALVPLRLREIEREIDARVGRLPTHVNEFGFDPYGFKPDVIRRSSLPSVLLYRYYFRTECHDLKNVPQGRVLLIANHAGQLPFDGLMLAMAMLLDAEPPRIVRAMGEFWIPRIPWFNVVAARGGMLVGTPENCVSMLEAGECVMVFPEGVRGMNKPFSERYRLQRMGLGFMRLALETDTPIVPVGIVGSEEQQPGLTNLPGLGRLFGMPAFPLTLGFPWLGPLGILPLPVKYHLYFGEPMRFEGTPTDEDASIEEKVDEVRRAISDLLERGRRERKGVFH
ncbi:MAG TPA: lysophospholipid acyltransferase family protein [Myxococcota bacterium]|nr:lysophospholipid acyltransferase family protein [Myxococcota bacterium]